jgi:tetratricopeptide (TPR) repeat protein
MSDIRHLMEYRRESGIVAYSETPSVNMAYKTLFEGDHESAENRFRRILQDDPLDHEAMAGLAVCVAEDGGKFLTAEKLARKAVAMDRKAASGYIALGYINLRGGRLEDGYKLLMKAKHLAPRDPRLAAGFAIYDQERPPVISDLSRLHPVNQVLGGARNYVESPTQRMMAIGMVAVGVFLAGNMLT